MIKKFFNSITFKLLMIIGAIAACISILSFSYTLISSDDTASLIVGILLMVITVVLLFGYAENKINNKGRC
jgi:uncharacterized membrane protein YfcA